MGSHFGVGAPPILVDFSGDWDVYWGVGLWDFYPWPYGFLHGPRLSGHAGERPGTACTRTPCGNSGFSRTWVEAESLGLLKTDRLPVSCFGVGQDVHLGSHGRDGGILRCTGFGYGRVGASGSRVRPMKFESLRGNICAEDFSDVVRTGRHLMTFENKCSLPARLGLEKGLSALQPASSTLSPNQNRRAFEGLRSRRPVSPADTLVFGASHFLVAGAFLFVFCFF